MIKGIGSSSDGKGDAIYAPSSSGQKKALLDAYRNAGVTPESIGLIEAPRGLLYYMLSINSTGKVKYGNIIVPTQQNQIGMEKSIIQVVQANMDKDKKQIEYEIEKLIRAYDPCMSCASHFLKINWR